MNAEHLSNLLIFHSAVQAEQLTVVDVDDDGIEVAMALDEEGDGSEDEGPTANEEIDAMGGY